MSDGRPTQPPAPKRQVYQRLNEVARFPYSLSEYARRFAWEWVQTLLIRPSPRRADKWRAFWLRAFGARIGPNSSVRPTTHVMHPWLLTMGEYSILSDGVKVYNLGAVTVGDHSVVSQDAYLCAGTHDYTIANLPLQRPTIHIGSGVWVCAGAFIGPGVTIGDNCVIAARAVVVKDAPPGMVLGGNPAKVIKERVMKN